MSDLVNRLRDHMTAEEAFCDKLLLQAADEIERLRALTEWQPIETAPKDGTKLIGYSGGRVSVIFYGEYYLNQFVWFTGGTLPTMNAEPQIFEPTHWMPSPETPKERR